MEKWEYELDKWLTTPPDEPESKCKCCKCGEELLPDDSYFELDDELYCEICAEDWLEGHRNWVTYSMAFED